MTRSASILATALVLLPGAASAQEPPSISPGARVRVWTSPTAEPVTGKVLGLDAATMTLSLEDGSPTAVTRTAITRMDVSRGRRSRGKAVLTGILIGVGTAFTWGLIEGDDPPNRLLAFSAIEKGLILNVLTVPAGALVGALVGPGPERWTTSTASPKGTLLSVPPSPSFRLTLRF